MTLVPNIKESPPKNRKTTKNDPKWAYSLDTTFHYSTFLTYLWPSGIEGQNEPFPRSVVTKLFEWHWFLSYRVAWRENIGKINNFEKSAKRSRKYFFLKILKNTHQILRSKATQNWYLTHDFLYKCAFYNDTMNTYYVKIAHVTKIRRR